MQISSCRFCRKNDLLSDEPLFVSEVLFVLGMRQEDRKHAVMIIPHDHAETPFDLSAQQWAGLPAALSFAKSYLAKFQPSGYSVGWNVGPVGGQTVPHVHLHVICRFKGEAATGLGINGLIKAVNAA